MIYFHPHLVPLPSRERIVVINDLHKSIQNHAKYYMIFLPRQHLTEALLMPKRSDIKKIMIIGSGPIIIGQACEFDYSGTQACKALRSLGYEVILVN